MTNTQRAQEIYDQLTPGRDQYLRMGMQPTGASAATVDQIQAHLDLVDEVAAEFGFRLDPSKFPFGCSRETIVAKAEAKQRRYNRRAGVRALERKYGHDAAARIVKKYSGRTIQ